MKKSPSPDGKTLNFLVDECCDTGLVNALREYGHDVSYVSEKTPGVSDDDVLLDASSQNRILLTEDISFFLQAWLSIPLNLVRCLSNDHKARLHITNKTRSML